MRLSVLICTTMGRVRTFLPSMVESLSRQMVEGVEMLYLGDNNSRTVGAKRNALLMLARGDYICFVDDDDRISDDYVSSILEALVSKPDCVVFGEMCSINGGAPKKVVYDINLEIESNTDSSYLRWPNQKMVFRRELALSVGFLDVMVGEDYAFASRVRSRISTVVRIDKVLYYYDFNSKTTEAQKS